MANLIIADQTVVVDLTAMEKVEALHGDVTVPRSTVTATRMVPDGMAEAHGLCAPGTGLPGVIMVGCGGAKLARRSLRATVARLP